MGFLARLLGVTLSIVLFIFTGSRTIDFFLKLLPGDATIFGFAAVAAFDVGFLVFMLYLIHGCEGVEQRVIAACMAIGDAAGVGLTFVGDVLLFGKHPILTPDWVPSGVQVVCCVIVVLNVYAWAGLTLLHPRNMARLRVNTVYQFKPVTHVVQSIPSYTETASLAEQDFLAPSPLKKLPRKRRGLLDGLLGNQGGPPEEEVPMSNTDASMNSIGKEK